MLITHERMSDQFAKHHLGNGLAVHHFTGPDQEGPHDHPFDFTSHILVGGYIEEVYHLDGENWSMQTIERKPGTSHDVKAGHIHRIVHLPFGYCVTLVNAGPHIRTTRFWRFDESGYRSAAWDEERP